MLHPTAYPKVNRVVDEMRACVQGILGKNFVGMYLYGSLATGDFDRASDIDFLVVTNEEISEDALTQLKTMHAQIAAGDSDWATDIEGAYLSLAALRRYQAVPHWQLERGAGRTLEMSNHFRVVERAVLRDCGIVVVGAPIQEFIEPVTADELRQAMCEMVQEWVLALLAETQPFNNRGDQSYNVLSMCRVLYTLETGQVISKLAAARWAQEKFGQRWLHLIERALQGRHNPQGELDPRDVRGTLDMARFAYKSIVTG